MLKNKTKKSVKQRGESSHGHGHKKKNRGSGNRGGFGNAGTGARGDSKKPTILKEFGSTYFGKRGFTSVTKKATTTLSLSYLEHNFDKLVEAGVIVKEKSDFVFDSTQYKYDKILGKGNFTKKMTIVCKDISESAKTRVEEVGGKVVVLTPKNFSKVNESANVEAPSKK